MKIQTNEKTIRLRYLRVLEKFLTRTVSLLKKENFDFDLYKKATIKNYEEMKKTPSVSLYNEYPVALENLVRTIVNSIDDENRDYEQTKELILKQSNLLDKLKNTKRYKKEKHKNKKFHDGY